MLEYEEGLVSMGVQEEEKEEMEGKFLESKKCVFQIGPLKHDSK